MGTAGGTQNNHVVIPERRTRHACVQEVTMLLLIPSNRYPVLTQTPRHEDIWVSGGIAPRILNLGTKWK